MSGNNKSPCGSCTRLFMCMMCCGSCVIIAGIVALVLGVQGYFAFKDPCVDLQSVQITNLELGAPKEKEGIGNNMILGLLDSFTGGLASEVSGAVPTEVKMTMEMIMEVNNTNPYSLSFQQNDVGQISIPEFALKASGRNDMSTIPPENANDISIGTWEIPHSTLDGNAQSTFPVTITAQIDLISVETAQLATLFVTGGTFMFRVSGSLIGSSWVPGIKGTTNLICLARVDNILNLKEDATVKCKQSTKFLGNTVVMTGDSEQDVSLRGTGLIPGDNNAKDNFGYVDQRCLV